MIERSIHLGLPIRGATSYGEFVASAGRTLIGQAVDDAAEWFEALDWIGIVLTPAASFQHAPDSPWCRYEQVPVKGIGPKSLYCCNWTTDVASETDLTRAFRTAGSVSPSVAGKYLNTLQFFRAMTDENGRPRPGWWRRRFSS
jgi:hypothetical protein